MGRRIAPEVWSRRKRATIHVYVDHCVDPSVAAKHVRIRELLREVEADRGAGVDV